MFKHQTNRFRNFLVLLVLASNNVVLAGPGDVSDLIGQASNVLVPAALLIGVVKVIASGYKIMFSDGNPQNLNEAKEDLTAAIGGSFFILMAAVIMGLVLDNIFK